MPDSTKESQAGLATPGHRAGLLPTYAGSVRHLRRPLSSRPPLGAGSTMKTQALMEVLMLHDVRRRLAALTLLAMVVLTPIGVIRWTAHAAGPALRSVSSSTANDSNFTAAAPAGEAAGDVLVAALQVNGKGPITPPTGWTLIGSAISGPNLIGTTTGSNATTTYVKVAGTVEPATYTCSSTVFSSGP